VNSVYIILCLISVVIASLFIVSGISRRSGRSEALNDVLEDEARGALMVRRLDSPSVHPPLF
jgi:hypothetical protein